jgi:hypothetical protein
MLEYDCLQGDMLLACSCQAPAKSLAAACTHLWWEAVLGVTVGGVQEQAITPLGSKQCRPLQHIRAVPHVTTVQVRSTGTACTASSLATAAGARISSRVAVAAPGAGAGGVAGGTARVAARRRLAVVGAFGALACTGRAAGQLEKELDCSWAMFGVYQGHSDACMCVGRGKEYKSWRHEVQGGSKKRK